MKKLAHTLGSPDRNLINVIRKGEVTGQRIIYIGVLEDFFSTYILDAPLCIPVETWRDKINGEYETSVLGSPDCIHKELRMVCQYLVSVEKTLGIFKSGGDDLGELIYISTAELAKEIKEQKGF